LLPIHSGWSFRSSLKGKDGIRDLGSGVNGPYTES
jgi:hypothetical protein